MKIVKEHINEKFEEDSDPIYDIGIGVPNINDIFSLFAEKDKNEYVFTIAITNNTMDFWFNIPIISILPDKKIDKLFKYVVDIINNIGFNVLLYDPILIECDFIRLNKTLPRIVRFTLNKKYIKTHPVTGEYRRHHRVVYGKVMFEYYSSLEYNYENLVEQKSTG